MTTMVLGSTPCESVRLLIPWTGAWIADCVLVDPTDTASLLSGQQTLTVGSTKLVGMVDPRATGQLGSTRAVRLVGGAAGWDNIIPAMHIHNDAAAGVTSAQVLAAVAAQVGETVNDPSPISYGPDWEFLSGPDASSPCRAVQALDGRQWYVDAAGVTQVSAWPTVALGADADVLHYDAVTRRAELSADEIVWPGTTFTDVRFGTLIARDIDQRFTRDGSRVTLWHGVTAVGRFGPLLSAIAGLGGQQWLKVYQYRIVTEGSDGRLQLQAVNPSAGAPNTLPISVWPGMAGLSAKYALGSLCSVVFLEGNKSLPRVVSFDGTSPLELYLDAANLIRLGALATDFAALSSKVDANFATLKKAFNAHAHSALNSPPTASAVNKIPLYDGAGADAPSTAAAKVKVL